MAQHTSNSGKINRVTASRRTSHFDTALYEILSGIELLVTINLQTHSKKVTDILAVSSLKNKKLAELSGVKHTKLYTVLNSLKKKGVIARKENMWCVLVGEGLKQINKEKA